MLRYQVFASYAIAFGSIWFAVLQKEKDFEVGAWGHLGLVLAPLIALVVLGLYLLLRLVTGVLSFQDCPEAAKELETQIKEARVELSRRKII